MSTMTMPKPTVAHRQLERLVGTWRGEERLYPSPFAPQGGVAVGHVWNRVALDGLAVIEDYEQEQDGATAFRGHGVFRWDENERSYSLHWFDSMGMPPSEFRGELADDVLTLVAAGPEGMVRAIWELRRADQYVYRMQVSPDGANWFPFMEGTYVREGLPA